MLLKIHYYQYCTDMGVDMVEIDVRKTKDGHIVLMHDGSIDELQWEDL